MGDWRVAKALETYRAQINSARPNRSKGSDGTIGDAAHASRSSDHNPWVMDGAMGVVTAMDITHDPKGGLDSYKLAEVLRTKKDKRIKYVISNRKIFSSVSQPWVWRPYSGSNPHDHHCHVSVQSSKSLYDSTSAWDFGDLFTGSAPSTPTSDDPPVLRRGDSGPWVVKLQHLLRVKEDGEFGPNTESALTLFQRSTGLEEDGICGGYTWRKLQEREKEGVALNNPVMTNIVCTMFGGSGDPNKSAYPPFNTITDQVLGCALPYKFPGDRPKVKVTSRSNGKSVTCDIVDVGPWNINDNYWAFPGGRPQAESGRDEKGRVTNLAGIDLTPAAAKQIDLGGLGKVDWEFIVPPGEGAVAGVTLENITEQIAKAAEQVAEGSAALSKATQALADLVASANKGGT